MTTRMVLVVYCTHRMRTVVFLVILAAVRSALSERDRGLAGDALHHLWTYFTGCEQSRIVERDGVFTTTVRAAHDRVKLLN